MCKRHPEISGPKNGEKRKTERGGAGSLVSGDPNIAFFERLAGMANRVNDAEALVALLNGNDLSHDGREHLPTILGILQTREHYMQALSRGEFSSHAQELIGALISDVRRLNDCLRRYSFIPQINPWDEHTRTYFTLPDSLEEDSERNGVMYALKLAERGEISSVRRCYCGKFFAAKRVDHGHCSTRCRVNEHQSSEEFKAKRRVADKERYRLHREGKVKENTRRKDVTQKTR